MLQGRKDALIDGWNGQPATTAWLRCSLAAYVSTYLCSSSDVTLLHGSTLICRTLASLVFGCLSVIALQLPCKCFAIALRLIKSRVTVIRGGFREFGVKVVPGFHRVTSMGIMPDTNLQEVDH